MRQQFNEEVAQVAGNNVVNKSTVFNILLPPEPPQKDPVGDNYHAEFTREMDEYEDFYRRTGIRASKPERIALTQLMTKCQFNPKQIKVAWNNGVLLYEDNRLKVKLPAIEPYLGIILVCLSALELILLTLKVMVERPPLAEMAQDGFMFVMFVFALIITTGSMVAPTYIGKRIKAAIEKD